MSLNHPIIVLLILGHYIMQYYGCCSTWQSWIFYSFFTLESFFFANMQSLHVFSLIEGVE